jgi:DNA-binding transcriptional LysR family regulator
MRILSNNIKSFYEVSRQGTVHAAARVLGLTQTAVTQRLQTLENDLGSTLFIRSRRGMTLTSAGEALARYCRQAVDLEGETLAALQAGGNPVAARVTIEGPSSLLRARVIPALTPVLRAYPELGVAFRMRDFGSSAAALKRGETDLAILKRADVADEFDSRLLKPEKYVLVGPPAWAKRPLADIVAAERIVDFDPSDEMTLHWLEKKGLREKARADRHFADNTDALASLIVLGCGYSVLAADFAKPFVARGELAVLAGGATLDFEIALAWYPRKHPPPYWAKILSAVR